MPHITSPHSVASRPEALSGQRLAVIVRCLDAPGRMQLAVQVAAGRIKIKSLTPTQICDLCRVPATHRARVLESTRARS